MSKLCNEFWHLFLIIMIFGMTIHCTTSDDNDNTSDPNNTSNTNESNTNNTNNSNENNTIPVLTWTKCEQNPVLESDLSHPWKHLVGDPCILMDGSSYKMWFAAQIIDSVSEISFASSSDGITWNEHNETIVKVGSTGTWDALNSETPSVIKNADGSYEMWYSGNGSPPDEPITWDMLYKIGRATSQDGISWTKSPSNPILDIDITDMNQINLEIWDALSVADPSVIKEGSQYKMWYSGGTFVDDNIVNQIGYATSQDGITWTKYAQNPVFALGQAGSWDSGMVAQPSVFHDGQRYVMFYAGLENYTAPEAGDIGVAFSDDGIHWERSDSPIIKKGAATQWDDTGTWGPTGAYVNGIYKLWYTGAKVSGQNISTGFGCATAE